MSRICVATADARAYFEFVSRLRRADLAFSSVVPGSDPECDVVLTTRKELERYGRNALAIEELDEDPGVFKAQLISRLGGEEDVILAGVDPGVRTGLAVFYGRTKLSFDTFGSASDVCARVAEFAKALPSSRVLVRIGNGSRSMAARLVDEFAREVPSAALELVDESGTSVRTSKMKGVQRDQVAAAKIAFRKGDTVIHATRTRR